MDHGLGRDGDRERGDLQRILFIATVAIIMYWNSLDMLVGVVINSYS